MSKRDVILLPPLSRSVRLSDLSLHREVIALLKHIPLDEYTEELTLELLGHDVCIENLDDSIYDVFKSYYPNEGKEYWEQMTWYVRCEMLRLYTEHLEKILGFVPNQHMFNIKPYCLETHEYLLTQYR